METAKNKYVQVRTRGLKNNLIFNDRKYVKNVRFVKTGSDTQVYDTEDAFYSIDIQNIKLTHEIARLQYATAKLEIDISETVNVNDLRTANEIIVIDNDNIYYQCRLLNITEEPIFESTFYIATLELQILKQYLGSGAVLSDIKTENIVYDYATSDYVKANYLQTFYTLVLKNYENVPNQTENMLGSLTFATKLVPTRNYEKIEPNISELGNGDIVVNKVIGWETLTIRLYLSEIDKNLLIKYIDICHFRDNGGANFGTSIGLYDVQSGYIDSQQFSIKPAKLEFTENIELQNIGIWQCDVTIYLNKMNYSPQLNK